MNFVGGDLKMVIGLWVVVETKVRISSNLRLGADFYIIRKELQNEPQKLAGHDRVQNLDNWLKNSVVLRKYFD